MPRRPPKSWDEARRRFLRTSAFAIASVAVVGVGVGYATGGMGTAVGLAVAFVVLLVLALGIVYAIGQREWEKREKTSDK
jgi:hypothetical protein